MKDELGTRIKEFYENRTRIKLPRRTYTIIRIDGKAFHSYTKGLQHPFDSGLIEDMNETAKYLCANIQGAKFAYVQSDEISVVLTDFEKLTTDAWFDGNVQKMTSVAASLATAKFNQLRRERFEDQRGGFVKPPVLAHFDARVFTIPTLTEICNYFVWRQQDCVRNSISSTAQSMFSHKELNGKSTNQMQEMMFKKGTNWNDFNGKLKRGRVIMKVQDGERTKWSSVEPPTFTADFGFIRQMLPENL